MFKSLFKTVLLAMAVVLAVACAPATANAATQDYAVAVPGVVTIPVQLSGQYTADVTAVARFAVPFKCRVLGATASARASGGTTPTLTVDVLDDGTSILSAPVAVTAGAVAEATISTAAVADESVVTLDLVITGTNPTWDDVTVLLTVIRE